MIIFLGLPLQQNIFFFVFTVSSYDMPLYDFLDNPLPNFLLEKALIFRGYHSKRNIFVFTILCTAHHLGQMHHCLSSWIPLCIIFRILIFQGFYFQQEYFSAAHHLEGTYIVFGHPWEQSEMHNKFFVRQPEGK